MPKFGQNDPIESCLVYDEDNGCLVYTTSLGNDKTVKLPSDKVTSGLTGECELVVMVNGVECDRINLRPILDKYNFNYDPNTHTITAGPDGAQVPFVLNCATLELDTTNDCELVYTNEKGGENRIPLPVMSMTRDADACTITAEDGKGGEFTFYEGANPETDIQFELDVNKDLCLGYKDKSLHVVLPNFLTDVALDQTNCILKVFKWCDDQPTDIDLFAALGLTKNDDGGFDLQIKNQLCTFKPATLTQDPNDPTKYVFDNGYGGTQIIDVNEIDMDVNNITIQNSVITFSTEDGQTIPVDICAIVAANCNASLAVNPDGSLTHVDNAGTTTPVDLCQLIIDNCGSTVFDDGDTFTFTQNDGTQAVVFKNPVKTVNGVAPDENGNVNSASTLVDNGDNSFTHTTDDGTATTVNTGSVDDNGDGSGTVTDSAGNSCVFAKGPIEQATVADEGNGTGIVTDSQGNTCTFQKNPSQLLDPGTNTLTHVNGEGEETLIFTGSVIDDGAGGIDLLDNAGNSCKASAVIPVKKDGSDYEKGDRPVFMDNAPILRAFTDDISDHTNPDCRSEIVCDDDGVLWGEARHGSWIERQQAFIFGNAAGSSDLTSAGGAGEFALLHCLGPFEFVNPDPCRSVKVDANFYYRGTTYELQPQASGSVALDLLDSPALGLQVAQFYSESFENREDGDRLFGTGNIAGSHHFTLAPGASTGPWYLCMKVNFNIASDPAAQIFTDGFTNAPLARVVWHATTCKDQ